MTIVFLIVLAVFALAMLGMAIGVILGNRSLRGSCGGLAGLKDETGQPFCNVCSNPTSSCRGPDGPRHAAP